MKKGFWESLASIGSGILTATGFGGAKIKSPPGSSTADAMNLISVLDFSMNFETARALIAKTGPPPARSISYGFSPR